MKIGILTFHAARNYGAVLQCRCLYEVLKGLGHDVSVIDYRPDYLRAPYKLWKKSFLKHPGSMLKVGTHLFGALRRDAGFSSFEKEIRLSPMEGVRFDAIFYGSDQIWNRNICNGPDPVFFAASPLAEGARNISYAASDGGVSPAGEEQKTIRGYLHNFYRIGVREYPMQERMDAAGIPATVNLDPVLLAGRSVTDKICSASPEKGRYILTYEAVDQPEVLSCARSIASEKGLRVVSIARTPYSTGNNRFSPKEFVALFKGAESIVTTSFHGVALSILYHKDFRFIPSGGSSDERILSLLDALGIKEGTAPDYAKVDGKLDKLRKESMNYIEEALK